MHFTEVRCSHSPVLWWAAAHCCEVVRREQARSSSAGARLVGAIGACTHRPPVRSLTTVMRTVVDTLMPASDCGAQQVGLSHLSRGAYGHATLQRTEDMRVARAALKVV